MILDAFDTLAIEQAMNASPGLAVLADADAPLHLVYGHQAICLGLDHLALDAADPRVTGAAVWADLDCDE